MSCPDRVFIANSRRNNKFANELVAKLSAHGIQAIVSGQLAKDHTPGVQEIDTALNGCEWFVLLVSPQIFKSRRVAYEYHRAIKEKRYEQAITAGWWRKCELKGPFWTVKTLKSQVNFVKNKEAGIRLLIQEMCGGKK